MSQTRMHAIFVALGLSIGTVFFAVIATIGLFVMLENVPWLYKVFKVVGGAYLCYLAFKIWNSRHEDISVVSNVPTSLSLSKMFLLGLFTQLSNPKTAVVFASAFAAFLPKTLPDYSHVLLAISALMIDAGWYVLVALLLSTAKAQKAYQNFKHTICYLAASFMALLAFKLLFRTP